MRAETALNDRELGGDAEQLADELCLSDHVIGSYRSRSAFSHHLHRLNPAESSPCSLQRTVAFGEPRSPFYVAVVLLNGLIANDKFCLSLVSSRKLDWVRGPRVGVGGRIGPASHPEGVRPPSGGEHATKVAGSTAVAAEVGCRAAVGSSLPTSPGVDSRRGIKRRLPAGALLYAKGEDQ
jgi:hypothetical protein